MAAHAPPSGRWLFGPIPDLALGCGLAYAFAFIVFAAIGPEFRTWHPVFFVPLVNLLISGPHYGGTLLRVYEQRADRRAYAIFAVWATGLVFVVFVMALHDVTIGSWLLSLYITWSAWHYTGQNYGLAVMFLRRRGVPVDPSAKRLLYGSFVGSFLIAFFAIHGSSEATGYIPNPVATGEFGPTMRSLGISVDVSRVALLAASVGTVAAAFGAFALLARKATWRDLGPAVALCGTQALWFSVPFSVRFWQLHTGLDVLDASAAIEYVLWIAMGHAVQYLWVTTYYARASESWRGYSRYLGKAMAAGAAVWTLPVVFFAPGRLGGPEYTGGLALMVAASVNIHHFILDGAIWKLRDSRIASILIRSATEGQAVTEGPRGPWLRRVTWTVCGASVAIAAAANFLVGYALPAALRAGDKQRAGAILDTLSYFGQENSADRVRLARAYVAADDSQGATAQFERSLELQSNAAAWTGLARLRAAEGDWPGALAVVEASARAGPLHPSAAVIAARAHYAMGEDERARSVMDGALAATPRSAENYVVMAQFTERLGRLEIAADYYREAIRIEPTLYRAANNLAWLQATAGDPRVRNPEEAVRLAEAVVASMEPANPNHLDTLAAAYAAAGRRDDAIRVAAEGARLAHERGNEALLKQLRRHLAIYRAGDSLHPVPDPLRNVRPSRSAEPGPSG